MSDEKTENKMSAAEVLRGGADVTVELAAGGTETVRVRQVRVRELEEYLRREMSGDMAIITWVTGKPDEWFDAITLDSWEALIAENQRQNFTAARRHEKRKIDKTVREMEAVAAGFPEIYKDVVEKIGQRMNDLMTQLPQPQPSLAAGKPPSI